MRTTRSEADLMKAKRCADLLYGRQECLSKEMIDDVLDELPMVRVEKEEKSKNIADLIVRLDLADSKSRMEKRE